MKRIYFIILSLCCIVLAASAQTGRNRKRSTTKTSQSRSNESKKIQKITIPAGLFSMQELERQRKKANADIELTTQLLNETSRNAKNSLNRLNLLSQQLLSRRKVIMLLGQEISAIDAKMDSLKKELDILGKDLEKARDNYAKSMQSQQQEHNTAQYKMLIILSAKNLSQSYRRMRYLKEYSDWQKEEAERIIKKQEEITKRRMQLENSKKEKQNLLAQRENENKKLEEEEEQQQREVRELNKKQRDLHKQLELQKKEADALDRQIENLIAEDIKKSESNISASTETNPAETKEAASNTPPKPSMPTTKNTKGLYVMTESELNLSNDFASNKGRLPFPLNGRHTIISKFGEHQHQELSHVRTNNNGIDIQTTSGAEARAVFKGVVTRVFVMPGFNNNIIVRHGNYLTVYSNLSQVYVKAGDVVATRQALGKIYTDSENGNSTILHFQIWKERTKLNPEPWLN